MYQHFTANCSEGGNCTGDRKDYGFLQGQVDSVKNGPLATMARIPYGLSQTTVKDKLNLVARERIMQLSAASNLINHQNSKRCGQSAYCKFDEKIQTENKNGNGMLPSAEDESRGLLKFLKGQSSTKNIMRPTLI